MNTLLLARVSSYQDKIIVSIFIGLFISVIVIALIANMTSKAIHGIAGFCYILGAITSVLMMFSDLVSGIIYFVACTFGFAILWGFGCIVDYLKQLKEHFVDNNYIQSQQEVKPYINKSYMEMVYSNPSDNNEEDKDIKKEYKDEPKMQSSIKILYSSDDIKLTKWGSKIIFHYKSRGSLSYTEYELRDDNGILSITQDEEEYKVQQFSYDLNNLISHYEKDDYNWGLSPKEFCEFLKKIVEEEM